MTQKTYDESQQKNAQLEQEYQQLNQSMTAEVGAKNMQITRMQDAIKVSVNSELLFPSGGWEMQDAAKTSIAKIAAILAPHQTAKINVNGYTDSTPIGPGLKKEGITTNLILSQKASSRILSRPTVTAKPIRSLRTIRRKVARRIVASNSRSRTLASKAASRGFFGAVEKRGSIERKKRRAVPSRGGPFAGTPC